GRIVERRVAALARPHARVRIEVDAAADVQPAIDPLVDGLVEANLVETYVDGTGRLRHRAERVRVERRPRHAVVSLDEPAVVRREDREAGAGEHLTELRDAEPGRY